jgi:hypothetical protein
LDNFPALQRFKLQDTFHHQASLEELQFLAHEGVTELKTNVSLSEWRESVPFGSIPNHLGFPSITRLEISILDSILFLDDDSRELWTSWPALEILHIEYRTTGQWFDSDYPDEDRRVVLKLDEFLSGIPETAFDLVTLELAHPASQPLELEALKGIHNKYKTMACISDLRYLREFKLQMNASYSLTNIGGYFGFGVANSRLEYISIIPGAKFGQKNVGRISEECFDLIKSVLAPEAEINL